ncbi:hypothetical protein U9M48_034375, partial [Paspalum notatum var. saurae]
NQRVEYYSTRRRSAAVSGDPTSKSRNSKNHAATAHSNARREAAALGRRWCPTPATSGCSPSPAPRQGKGASRRRRSFPATQEPAAILPGRLGTVGPLRHRRIHIESTSSQHHLPLTTVQSV